MSESEPTLLDLVTEDTLAAMKADPQAINGMMVVAMDNLLLELGVYTKEQMADAYNKLFADRARRIAEKNVVKLEELGYTVEKYLAARAQAEKMQSTFKDIFGSTFDQGEKDAKAHSDAAGQEPDGGQGGSAEEVG
jgi:hypothetical protein